MGGCCGVERVPGEDGASRSGNRCMARFPRAEAWSGAAVGPGWGARIGAPRRFLAALPRARLLRGRKDNERGEDGLLELVCVLVAILYNTYIHSRVN